jgi:phage-related protein
VAPLKGESLKPVVWIRSSKDDLKKFPRTAQSHIGFALKFAQSGGKHPDSKPMKGFGGAGVVEIVEDYDGETYRAVYTVKFAEAIYVLHAFQKKSKSGIATPRREIDLIDERLKRAKELHALSVHSKR